MNLKQRIRHWRKILLAPIDSKIRKAKFFAERFVIKTVNKHGLNLSSISVTQVQQIQPNPSEAGSTMVHVIEPGRQLLAFLKASQRSDRNIQPAFQAVPIGNGLVLVPHPHVGYMYADTQNVALLPRLVIGDYQADTTLALERSVQEGDTVLHFGAKQGYHMLTLAHLVGSNGHVVSLESSPDLRAFKLNVEAHLLGSTVTTIEREFEFLELMRKLHQKTTSCIVVIEEQVELSQSIQRGLLDLLSQISAALVIVGSQVLDRNEFVDMTNRTSSTLATTMAAA